MNFEHKLSAFVLALAGASGMAQATPLVSEAITTNVDVTPSFFGGTLLESVISHISNASYNGIARAAVYDTGTGLDFYYQFSNDISSVNGIERFSGYNFTSIGSANLLDVYQTPAAFGIFLEGSEQSDYADRTNFGVVGFSFVPNGASKINPGTTSYTQILRTSARYYTDGNFGLLDGIGDNAAGFATAAVPEPATGTLLLVGLAMGGWISSRRRRT